MRKGKPILDAKGRPRFVRGEAKDRHWSRTAFNAMVTLWREAWLTSDRTQWDAGTPMMLDVQAHFDGREGGFLEATLAPWPHGGHAATPDLDNIVKLCAEAAQKAGVVTNDSQIVVLWVQKTREAK
jgi:hypothetical protein